MKEVKFRYKVKGKDKLIYDSDPDFGYITTNRKLISYGNGGILFVEDEMQYANLKDKNKKEIWEGDIIKISWIDIAHGCCEQISAVKWNNNYAGYGNIYNNSNYKIEVIGNIHENPELVKKCQ